MTPLYPWHKTQWQSVQARRRAAKLPHALLLCGPPGLGKSHFADILAQSLLCEQIDAEGLPCGTCRACRLYGAGTHPDFRRVAPLEEGKIIGVDQVRELNHYLAHTPQYGACKLVLISPADKMNINSSNSLLKVLEEPPSYGVLMLVSAQPSRLPVTVRSRCQRVSFTIPEPSLGRAWLTETLGPDADAGLLLSLAAGSPLRARDLAGNEVLQNRERLWALMEQGSRKQGDPVAAAEAALKIGAKETLYSLHSWISDMIRLASCPDPVGVHNTDMKPRLAALAQGRSLTGLYRALDQVNEALLLIERPLNLQLMLENIMITWQTTFQARKAAI